MINRRIFLRYTGIATAAVAATRKSFVKPLAGTYPVVISTWAPNVKANAAAWAVLEKGGRAIDALETGVKVTEADPRDQSVGYGGLPDRDGRVTLDACIMDEFGNCGAVMFLEHIKHPISVARLVMEKTPHVQLAGEGALRFALSQGFKKENLLTPESELAWRNWLKTSKYDPMNTLRNVEERMRNEQKEKAKGKEDKENDYPWPVADLNHDTIGMICIDAKGNASGACSTSGMAFKMNGRVGDSPIIGAGLFSDNEVGAATATGVGEEVVRICGSHTIVELMRQGMSPEMACKKTVERIIKKRGQSARNLQVGFIAVNKAGEFGAFAVAKGVNYAVRNHDGEKVYDAPSWF